MIRCICEYVCVWAFAESTIEISIGLICSHFYRVDHCNLLRNFPIPRAERISPSISIGNGNSSESQANFFFWIWTKNVEIFPFDDTINLLCVFVVCLCVSVSPHMYFYDSGASDFLFFQYTKIDFIKTCLDRFGLDSIHHNIYANHDSLQTKSPNRKQITLN